MEKLGEGKGGWLRTEGRDSYYLDEIIIKNCTEYLTFWCITNTFSMKLISQNKARWGEDNLLEGTPRWLRGRAKALPQSQDPWFRGSSKSRGPDCFVDKTNDKVNKINLTLTFSTGTPWSPGCTPISPQVGTQQSPLWTQWSPGWTLLSPPNIQHKNCGTLLTHL